MKYENGSSRFVLIFKTTCVLPFQLNKINCTQLYFWQNIEKKEFTDSISDTSPSHSLTKQGPHLTFKKSYSMWVGEPDYSLTHVFAQQNQAKVCQNVRTYLLIKVMFE